MPIAICTNVKCGAEVPYRNTRGTRIAELACPTCGSALRGRGAGAKRGPCVACDRLCESTVPDLGVAIEVYAGHGVLGVKLLDVDAGDHVCWRHSLRGACGCSARLTWRHGPGALLPRVLYQGVEPCPIHGGSQIDGPIVPPRMIRVTIRDRASESAWGDGPLRVVLATVEIPDACLTCAGPHGATRHIPQHEDGVDYGVDVWENPCGHTDRYERVMQAVQRGEGRLLGRSVR
jgi:hypothetical protein